MEIAQRLAAATALLAISTGCAPASAPTPVTAIPGETWPMYRGDLARDGHPPTATLGAKGTARLGLAWRAHFGGAVDGTPAVSGGLVIVGGAAGELRAMNAVDGSTVWSRRDLGAISASPTISRDRVYVASLTGFVYAIDLMRGDIVWTWKLPAEGAIWASPVAYADEVIVGAASPYGDQPLVPGRVFGLDAGVGRQRWTFCSRLNCEPGGGVWSTPSIDEHGVAFVGLGNPVDGVLAFDALTGARKWLSSLYADEARDLDVGASPVVFDLGQKEVVAQASVQGLFAVLDAADGSLVWKRSLVEGSAVHGLLATPAADGNALYAVSASAPTGVFAVKPSDGSPMWNHETARPIYSAPAAGKDVLIFGTGAVLEDVNAGSIVALSAADGHVLFNFETHSAVRSGPAIAGSLVVAGDAAGDLFAFRPKS